MDITGFSNKELSLQVFNDEGLYDLRHDLDRDVLNKLGFSFTEEQFMTFKHDLENED